ncbi:MULTISPECIES: hypothetical protein [Curtobacterium]|uniref:hypothetical protein n=1 Tax=Curtobacterium TaxID=2034 RepID=UPI000AC98847|nr:MULTISPECIES: hypothetical protein [Curtobacterium]
MARVTRTKPGLPIPATVVLCLSTAMAGAGIALAAVGLLVLPAGQPTGTVLIRTAVCLVMPAALSSTFVAFWRVGSR